jgi:predicted deacylase
MISFLDVEVGASAVKKIKVGEGSSPEPVFLFAHILRGAFEGPTLLLNSGVHGDEAAGPEFVLNVLKGIDTTMLRGCVIAVPVVNVKAYEAGVRCNPGDKIDMNRVFPGDPEGSITLQVAYNFFHEVVSNADYLIDVHSAAFPEVFLPHSRVRVADPSEKALQMIHAFGADLVWKHRDRSGMLQVCAFKNKVPAITAEVGGVESFKDGVNGVFNVMKTIGMLEGKMVVPEAQIFINKNRRRLKSPLEGVFETRIRLGDVTGKGDILGCVSSQGGSRKSDIVAPFDCIVAGLNTGSIVNKGSSLFFLLPLTRGGDGKVEPMHSINVPELPNTVYRKNRLLERIYRLG